MEFFEDRIAGKKVKASFVTNLMREGCHYFVFSAFGVKFAVFPTPVG